MRFDVACPHCKVVNPLDLSQLRDSVPCSACGKELAVSTVSASRAGAPAASLPAPAPVFPLVLWPGWSDQPAKGDEPENPLSLQRASRQAWIDRVLPARPRPFLLVVFGLAVACWLLGLLLAADRHKFLTVREWYAQLIYLPVHFITLRLFVTLYTRNYLAGAAYLHIPATEAVRRMRQVLGPVGLLALLIAAPFCVWDFRELDGDLYRESLVGPSQTVEQTGAEQSNAVGAADLLMWGIWSVEWVITAYIWGLLLGFLVLTTWTLWRYSFRDPVEVVLDRKQYRPFLLMSGQGATIVLVFTIATALYVWDTEGALTDYIGLGVTVVLLLLGFGPTWMQLKARVEGMVNGEIGKLRTGLIAAHQRDVQLDLEGAASLPSLAAHINEVLLMLRIDYLDRSSQQLGRGEGKALLVKLLAPMGTIFWGVLRPLVAPFLPF